VGAEDGEWMIVSKQGEVGLLPAALDVHSW
jgi:hypothetical protein